MKRILFLPLMLILVSSYGQYMHAAKTKPESTSIIFEDTIRNFVFDSLSNNLGNIIPVNENNVLIKHFKYIGTDSIYIVASRSSDPHYICAYPKEVLIPNKIYSFNVCFWHEGRQGKMFKVMYLYLSDETEIAMIFSGNYVPDGAKK